MADVLNSFENEEVRNSCLSQHVTVKSSQRTLTITVMQKTISIDAGIQYSNSRKRFVCLKSPGQDVGPATVHVGLAGCTVSDAIAERNDGASRRVVGLYLDFPDKRPRRDVSRSIKCRCVSQVSCRHIVRLQRITMHRTLTYRLGRYEQTDSKIRERRDLQINWIAHHNGAGWQRYGSLPIKEQSLHGRRFDGTASSADRDICCADGQRLEAQFIRQHNAHRRAPSGYVNDLAVGCINLS